MSILCLLSHGGMPRRLGITKRGRHMFPQLETERLRLRELTAEDASMVLSCFSNEDVIRFYGQEKMAEIEEAERVIDFFAQNFREGRGIRWGIERKETSSIIGTVGLNAWVPKHKRAEIGYELHPDYWGMGYASEAVSAILAYGFDDLELTRIGAVVFLENGSSNRLLKNLGFQREGILRRYIYQNKKANDVYMYSLVREVGNSSDDC